MTQQHKSSLFKKFWTLLRQAFCGRSIPLEDYKFYHKWLGYVPVIRVNVSEYLASDIFITAREVVLPRNPDLRRKAIDKAILEIKTKIQKEVEAQAFAVLSGQSVSKDKEGK